MKKLFVILILLVLVSFSASAQQVSYQTHLQGGWNLLGNPFNNAQKVQDIYGTKEKPKEGVTEQIKSIWLWYAPASSWQFYSPLMSAEENSSFAASKGYGVLNSIIPGNGYWVNTKSNTNIYLPSQEGTMYEAATTFQPLPGGWNLMAAPWWVSPETFNEMVAATPPLPETKPQNFISLWVWDTNQYTFGQWRFYSPQMSAKQNADYAAAKGYGDFSDGHQLQLGKGMWINKFHVYYGGKG